MPFSFVKQSVDKPTNPSPGLSGNKLDKIIIFDYDDVASYPGRDGDGVQITSSIVMKANCKMVSIYGTVNTIKTGSSSEGDTDAEGFVHNVEFEFPGNSIEIRKFKTGWIGKNVGIIVSYRDDGIGKSIFGEPGCPMRLQVKQEDNKDKNTNTLTFKMVGKSVWDVGYYKGTLTLDKVLVPRGIKNSDSTVAADATTVDLVDGYLNYYLTDGTESAKVITTCTNATVGQIFTLVGSGGTNPSTITGGDFILKDGLAWTALEDAKISFQAFADGEASWKFIELGRE